MNSLVLIDIRCFEVDSIVSFFTDLRKVEVPRVENAREKLVDITAYESALIRRPHIIYISVNVRCLSATQRETYTYHKVCSIVY